MKKMLVIAMFTLAMLAWAAAQQPGSTNPSGGQPTSPSTQAPGASQSQPPAGSTDQAQPQGSATDAPVTEGCLGGTDPNYTITDKAGTTYKLNIPANKDTSKLAAHVGESVQVAGNVNGSGKGGDASIDVRGIGRGMGTCPGAAPKGEQTPPKR